MQFRDIKKENKSDSKNLDDAKDYEFKKAYVDIIANQDLKKFVKPGLFQRE